jgi:type II secretion system protein N
VKRLVFWLVVLAVFTAGMIATFPTDRLVQELLARLPADAARTVEHVGSSHLGLHGLTLEDVTLRPRPDAPPLALRSVAIRPSLLGVLRGRGGRPWQAWVHGCAGSASATLGPAPDDIVTIHFADLDLVACLVPLQLRDVVEGRATGDATLVTDPQARTWSGVLGLTGARWQAPRVPRNLALRADQATIRWRFDDQLHVDDLTLSNDEFSASGSGVVRFPPPPAAPELDLRVRIQPTAAMPQAHRDLFNRLPGSPPEPGGARTYRIAGPTDAPQLGVP